LKGTGAVVVVVAEKIAMRLLSALSEVAIGFACVLGVVHLAQRQRERRRTRRDQETRHFSEKSH